MHAPYLKPLITAALAVAAFGCQAKAEPKSNASALPPADAAKASPASGQLNELAESLEESFAGQQQPEAVRMLIAIARGLRLGPGKGWFGPGQSRYTWDWLVGAQGLNGTKEIAKAQFRGEPAWFERLDRDGDGRIVEADLDWSDDNPAVQQYYLANRALRHIDRPENGHLTRDEWLALFDQAAAGREHVAAADLAGLLRASQGGDLGADDEATPTTLIRGLFRGEIGSLNEGPSVNAPAPDFQLKTHDGKQTIRLSELRGAKPVVLVFGNFTCGPFRSMYPLVDALKQRYQEQAEFLAVYLRETHPSDGWRMRSNVRSGVDFVQPKTYDERVMAARQCHAALKYSMPLVVDAINDPVGNNYSGMPSRLYVIDREGKVAYKSGRGPLGFKPGEMEQALLMTLIEQRAQAAPPSQ